MRLEAGFYMFDKNEKVALSAHFSTHEFACHCTLSSCAEQRIDENLVSKLELVRQKLGSGIRITSGYRCHERQEELRKMGKETANGISMHELGKAADVQAKDMAKLTQLCDAEFSAMGVAKSFLHVDMRNDKKRRWGYVKE